MPDTITIRGLNGTTIGTVNSNTVTIDIDSTGTPTYNNQTIRLIEAELNSNALTVHALGNSLTMNNIRATASASDVSSLISWASNPTTPGLDITYETPTGTGNYMEWVVGEGIPPVKLTVKIVRL
ncbi:MAG TPA: hypothetical protein PKW35_02695 [Nannocystaceae bacterium]|nr:hypothetical protein [Nannocystaceae bacterium]